MLNDAKSADFWGLLLTAQRPDVGSPSVLIRGHAVNLSPNEARQFAAAIIEAADWAAGKEEEQ